MGEISDVYGFTYNSVMGCFGIEICLTSDGYTQGYHIFGLFYLVPIRMHVKHCMLMVLSCTQMTFNVSTSLLRDRLRYIMMAIYYVLMPVNNIYVMQITLLICML